MKILLLNNTAGYHSGSRQVMQWFNQHFAGHDVHVYDKGDAIDYANLDLAVFNGEGTAHDNGKKMRSCLNILQQAHDAGARTILANSIWQNNNDDVTEILMSVDRVIVREVRSRRAILSAISRKVEVCPDVSYFLPVPYQQQDAVDIVAGNAFVPGERMLISGVGETAQIDIFTESWDDIVNRLRHARVLVTARQHEMYAACVARCPFVVIESETHKNGGMLETWAPAVKALPRDADTDQIKQAIAWTLAHPEYFDGLWTNLERLVPPNLLD
jgi:exopolysaccharide biosynthesis predicted pyruvyltransferase EpsI